MSAKELSASFLATFGGLSLKSVDSWKKFDDSFKVTYNNAGHHTKVS